MVLPYFLKKKLNLVIWLFFPEHLSCAGFLCETLEVFHDFGSEKHMLLKFCSRKICSNTERHGNSRCCYLTSRSGRRTRSLGRSRAPAAAHTSFSIGCIGEPMDHAMENRSIGCAFPPAAREPRPQPTRVSRFVSVASVNRWTTRWKIGPSVALCLRKQREMVNTKRKGCCETQIVFVSRADGPPFSTSEGQSFYELTRLRGQRASRVPPGPQRITHKRPTTPKRGLGWHWESHKITTDQPSTVTDARLRRDLKRRIKRSRKTDGSQTKKKARHRGRAKGFLDFVHKYHVFLYVFVYFVHEECVFHGPSPRRVRAVSRSATLLLSRGVVRTGLVAMENYSKNIEYELVRAKKRDSRFSMAVLLFLFVLPVVLRS